MSADEILDDLFTRRTRGIKPGLERMFEAAKRIGNPESSYDIVHVAGTNGKGSTSSIIAAVLEESGEKVGLFTSPHIVEFRERFIVNKQPVEDSAWIDVWNTIQPVCDELELTFFEISALMAFELFKRENCTKVVLETGLGGRLDATNICNPIMSVITALSIEHTEFLGETLEEIAGEKLGIVKEGKPLVINGNNKLTVLDLAINRAHEKGSEIRFGYVSDIPKISDEKNGQRFEYRDRELFLPLKGDFQQQNCAVAVKACEYLGYSHETIVQGVAKAFIPCRLQRIEHEGVEILFDVAHNPQAVEILTSSLDLSEKPHFLVGMMKDKDVGSMLESICSNAYSVTAITPSIPRAMPAAELGEIIEEQGPSVEVRVAETVAQGVDEWLKKDGLHVVTGSFYTVSEVLTLLGISPFNH